MVEKHNIQYETDSIIDRTLMLQRPSMERPKMKNFKDVQVQVDFENEVVNETETKIEAAPKTEEKLNCSLRCTFSALKSKF